jgi:hypothetical protein
VYSCTRTTSVYQPPPPPPPDDPPLLEPPLELPPLDPLELGGDTPAAMPPAAAAHEADAPAPPDRPPANPVQPLLDPPLLSALDHELDDVVDVPAE